ncbi:MAG TPA: EfeM/EfeO family lipoprotein [Streptosporangiaceae bacterium]|nr:EfeM/EfeO family lipoprotein [Streptosporangiaceae bacterium]
MRKTPLLTIAVLAAMASLTACGGGGASNTISFNSASCGGTWTLARPGWHTFDLYNANDVGGEIDLIDPRTSGIYAEVDQFGPGTRQTMSLDVGSGRYAFRCLFDDQDPLTGPTVTVPGHVKGFTATVPVTFNDLVGPEKAYQAYVAAGLKTLVGQTGTLAGDVQRGNLTAARRDWLPAHLTYETLGAAYDAFGSFDDEIDGRADALGVTSPQWTGFYRLEYGLWHGQSAGELAPYASKLAADVKSLLAAWPTMEIPLIDIGLRTHEILENALEFQLTGHDDYGSGTTLATTLANIQGTRELLALLHPLLVTRYPGLPGVQEWLNRLQALLEAQHQPDGAWVPVSQLPAPARQDIDAACSQALQDLAPIASIAEPRNT